MSAWYTAPTPDIPDGRHRDESRRNSAPFDYTLIQIIVTPTNRWDWGNYKHQPRGSSFSLGFATSIMSQNSLLWPGIPGSMRQAREHVPWLVLPANWHSQIIQQTGNPQPPQKCKATPGLSLAKGTMRPR